MRSLGGRNANEFIKYKFIRASRKKEINFHKFESQIKLEGKAALGEGSGWCLVAKPSNMPLGLPPSSPLPPVVLWLWLLLFSFSSLCGFELARATANTGFKSSCIFEPWHRETKWKLNDLHQSLMPFDGVRANEFYENFIHHSSYL
jgi:hypothetical protein